MEKDTHHTIKFLVIGKAGARVVGDEGSRGSRSARATKKLLTLLAFGPEVKVLEPISLQEQMKEMVKKTMLLYGVG